MSQNFRVAMGDKMKVIFLAHPQNRFEEFGLKFCEEEYANVKADLEEVCGHEITNDAILDAIKVYNKSRAARREFVKLANEHCDVVTPTKRSAVLKAFFFMEKPDAQYAVFQKSVVSFEEKGAEGAAVTWSGMELAPGPDEPAVANPVVKLNRPFLFFINEASTDACIFAGKMVKF